MTAAPIELHPAETIPASPTTNGHTRSGKPTSYRHTDYGNAERLIARHGEDLLYHRGKWYVWDGTRFRMDETGAIDRRAKETVRSIYDDAAVAADSDDRKRLAKHAADSEARARLTAMVSLASSELPVVVEDTDSLDADPWLLNCTNGTVDLRTGTVRPHDRTDRITRTTGVAADLDATAPTWEAFLEKVLPDPATREYVQRVAGYTLSGSTREEKLFLLNGGGSNGKSTLIELVMSAIGEYAMKAPPDLLIAKQQSIPNDVAALRGSRLASVVETEDGARLAESRTKELASGDTQSARFLHGEFFSFQPVAKYWIATNHRPIIRGSDEAIWRRMVLIPFRAYFSEEEKDPKLKGNLRAELPGILAWIIRGCLVWQQHGLTEPPEIKAATSHYRAEQDLIGGFLEAECVLHPDAYTPASALYAAYRTWCENAGENPQTQRRFGQRLGERRGLSKAKGGQANTVTWYGVGLRASWQHLVDAQPATTQQDEPPAQTPDPTLTPAPEPHPADAPCATCAAPGEFCGFGYVAAEGDEQPCVVCGQPTLMRSRCEAPRTAHCSPGGDGTGTLDQPEPPSPESDPRSPGSRPRRLRPVSNQGGIDAAQPEEQQPTAPEEQRQHFAKAVRDAHPEATDADLDAAFALWHEVTDGIEFRSYPGETGVAAYSRLVSRYNAMPLPKSPQNGAATVTEMSERLTMFRDYLTPGLTFPEGTSITGIDVCAQFVGAAASVELGDGDPDVITAPRSIQSLLGFPGYIELATAVDTKHPAFGKLSKGTVLTTDTAKYLVKNRKLKLQAVRAVVFRNHGRRLARWAKDFGSAYQALHGKTDLPSVYALTAVKAVYTAFLGGMLRSERYNKTTLLRPDWSDQLVTLAGANMLRALDKAIEQGHTLVGVWRDAAWFASTEPEPIAPAGLEFRIQPGKWKIDRFAAMTDDMRTAYDRASPANFRDALIAAIDGQEQPR